MGFYISDEQQDKERGNRAAALKKGEKGDRK